jgi:hypothetical protein
VDLEVSFVEAAGGYDLPQIPVGSLNPAEAPLIGAEIPPHLSFLRTRDGCGREKAPTTRARSPLRYLGAQAVRETSNARLVQHHLLTRRSIIDRDTALTVGANQELVTLLMRVLSADFPGRNAGNDEIPPWSKREFTLELSNRQVARGSFTQGK